MIPKRVLVLAILVFGYGNEDEEEDTNLVDYYEKLINTEYQHAEKYELDKNAKRYQPKSEKQNTDFGTYDFIIVGSGSTGSVIANRLTEINNWNVLLIEAGGYENNFTEIPAMTTISLLSDYNWGFLSVPQKTSCLGMKNQRCPFPRGRALGGTTVVNGLAYSRGSQEGFNQWAKMGFSGWSYDKVLPYFKKAEDYPTDWKEGQEIAIESDMHGEDGPLLVEFSEPESEEYPNYIGGNEDLGYKVIDVNAGIGEGVSKAPTNTQNGRRYSAYKAYIKPAETRENLKIMSQSYVTKLIIENNKATGVRFAHNGKYFTAKASKEVIVSAGAISTPQLLMLSGIGPKKHLKSKKINVIKDLEVGSALRDHIGITLYFSSNYTLENKQLREYVQEFLKGVGGLAAPGPNDAFGFYQTHIETIKDYPDVEIILVPNFGNATKDFSKKILNLKDATYKTYTKQDPNKRIFKIDLFGLHAHSTGTVRLNSNSPFDYPLIDPNLLTDKDNKDINTLYEAINMVMKLIQTPSMKKMDTQLVIPQLPACKYLKKLSQKFWKCVIKQVGHPVNHPVGTCAMGLVVDENLKVYGVDKLRVADASIFPLTLTGHPNAPCVMVGEKVSDIIKSFYGVN
ncbi:unnamed protein product [Brassicogethes aeneus]|uniref:Glucose-methanol-choline oxidoreductase N-terminal domain-containing protein n=1 Tax=Brassicogethes aeneus TaxID=1431903 RepID=A0A9P0AW72_BRAAE|nr:unnamed protein product [Brassicogethes aeneus]